MTAGIPGAGIAGLFYLACALLMPLRHLTRIVTARRQPRGDPNVAAGLQPRINHSWRFIIRLVAMSAAMLASLWLGAWAIGWLVAIAAGTNSAAAGEAARALPRGVVRGVAWLTAGTLLAVLALVELLRVVLGRRIRTAMLALMIAGAAGTASAAGQPAAVQSEELSARLARAESAYQREALDEAAEAYARVLEIDPRHPRALFRLGQLRRAEPARAIPLFEAYTQVVPRDAWGHLALSSSLADAGRYDEALNAYERANELEPDDRDIALGRPRLLARIGHRSLALDSYRDWVTRHPDDLEAWRELATLAERLRRWPTAADAWNRLRQADPDDERAASRFEAARTRAAPAVEFAGLGVGETDISTFGFQAAGDVAAGDVARVGGLWQRRRISSFGEVVLSDRFMGQLVAHSGPDVRFQLAAGVVARRPEVEGGGETVTTPEARARFRRRFAADRGGIDVRAQYGPVDAAPTLALDDLTRRLVGGVADVPVGTRWRARGLGSLWLMARPDQEANRGMRFGGSLAFQTLPGMHVSGGWQQSRYRDPGAGYFAPERAEVIEGGIELERERGVFTISLDAGGGIQRVQRHGAPMGAWDSALRGWAMLAWALAPGRQFTVELEAYDSRVTDAVVVSTERWRYASITAGLRIAMR
jgi:tetratricopeptide (TPR) repeat protein